MTNLLELVDTLEITSAVRSPATPLKLVALGRVVGLKPGDRVIDFGCGCGEALCLWAQYFGITGIGVDLSGQEQALQRADKFGLNDRLEFVKGNAAEYGFTPHAFDLACCIGASFIWGGFRGTIRRLREAVKPGGAIIIGEPYFVRPDVPQELIDFEGNCNTEPELFQIARQEGCDIAYVARASADNWDRYALNTVGELRAMHKCDDPELHQQRLDRIRHYQDMFVTYRRDLQGWAMYVLA